MSHVRKAIERAVDIDVRNQTLFSKSQCGFRPNCGTENAILRFIYAAKRRHNNIAVLDIKGAFPSVPRPRLLQCIRSRLNTNTAAMTTLFLTPDRIQTAGDPTRCIKMLTTGVPEGGAISPTLFNLHIDTLILALENVPTRISLFPRRYYVGSRKCAQKADISHAPDSTIASNRSSPVKYSRHCSPPYLTTDFTLSRPKVSIMTRTEMP